MPTSKSPNSLANIQALFIDHFGGGTLSIASPNEVQAFTYARVDATADLVELCATATKEAQPAVHNSLIRAFHMLQEVKVALLHTEKTHQLDTFIQR